MKTLHLPGSAAICLYTANATSSSLTKSQSPSQATTTKSSSPSSSTVAISGRAVTYGLYCASPGHRHCLTLTPIHMYLLLLNFYLCQHPSLLLHELIFVYKLCHLIVFKVPTLLHCSVHMRRCAIYKTE